MPENLPNEAEVKTRKKRLRRKKGSTKFSRKRQYRPAPQLVIEQAAENTPPPEQPVGTTFEDLPNEIICLILQELRGMDYLKYRQLRLSERFGGIIDTRFYVFEYDCVNTSIYTAPDGATTRIFNTKKEFLYFMEELSYRYKVRYEEMTIYLDFRTDDPSNTQAQLCQDISTWCLHNGVFLSVLANASRQHKMFSAVQTKKMKGTLQVTEFLNTVDGDGRYNISRNLTEQGRYRLYEFLPSMVVDTNLIQSAVDLFNLNCVHWKSSIQKLKDLMIIHTNGTLLQRVLQLETLKNLTHLDCRTKDTTKVANLRLDSLEMDNLTNLNLWGGLTLKFTNNRFPKLTQLYIEDLDVLTDFRARSDPRVRQLDFKGNHMPNLKILAISTHRLQVFEFDDMEGIPKLDKFRLELRELNSFGNMIHLIETFRQTTHLSLMTKKALFDVGIITTYLAQLLDSSPIQSLSINFNGAEEGDWLRKLQEKKLPKLETLRLYNLNIENELPTFSMPQLRNIIIMGTFNFPKSIAIRGYPKLEHIYTRKHSSSAYNRDLYEYCVSQIQEYGPPTPQPTLALTPDVRMASDSVYTWSLANHSNVGSKTRDFKRYDLKGAGTPFVHLQHHQRGVVEDKLIIDTGWYIQRTGNKTPG